jgi:uncharacterized membrane protein|uniref:Uncharacterized protein ycf33 n=1 Tax=Baffinella frigidus TaxID=2571260 RepID=A0A7T8G5S3_9CRYP|nr:hypothetical plastid protein 33 [Cryptophyta sp. CCMP2293]
MPTFWENVFRFPRFFIGTIIGLILTIVGPFLNLLRRPKTTIIFIILFVSIIAFTVLTLQAMLGE